MKNLPLFIFDLLTLPVTLIRLGLIYFFGSRYGINGFEFVDVMMHAENKYFNQQEDSVTVDTIIDDIRVVINKASLLKHDELVELPVKKEEKIVEIKKEDLSIEQPIDNKNDPIIDQQNNMSSVEQSTNIPNDSSNKMKEDSKLEVSQNVLKVKDLSEKQVKSNVNNEDMNDIDKVESIVQNNDTESNDPTNNDIKKNRLETIENAMLSVEKIIEEELKGISEVFSDKV